MNEKQKLLKQIDRKIKRELSGKIAYMTKDFFYDYFDQDAEKWYKKRGFIDLEIRKSIIKNIKLQEEERKLVKNSFILSYNSFKMKVYAETIDIAYKIFFRRLRRKKLIPKKTKKVKRIKINVEFWE